MDYVPCTIILLLTTYLRVLVVSRVEKKKDKVSEQEFSCCCYWMYVRAPSCNCVGTYS